MYRCCHHENIVYKWHQNLFISIFWLLKTLKPKVHLDCEGSCYDYPVNAYRDFSPRVRVADIDNYQTHHSYGVNQIENTPLECHVGSDYQVEEFRKHNLVVWLAKCRDVQLQYEELALWIKWINDEMASQLGMCLYGNAQLELSEFLRAELFDYAKLKHSLTKRFCRPERETAFPSVSPFIWLHKSRPVYMEFVYILPIHVILWTL